MIHNQVTASYSDDQILTMTLYQVRHLHGEENWSKGLRSARGPGGGEPKNGDDHLCLPHGERHEEGVKETHTYTTTQKCHEKRLVHPTDMNTSVNCMQENPPTRSV